MRSTNNDNVDCPELSSAWEHHDGSSWNGNGGVAVTYLPPSMPPPSPPSPPRPPPRLPAPPLAPCVGPCIRVYTASEIKAALDDPSIDRIMVQYGTYAFTASDITPDCHQSIAAALCITRPVTIEAEIHGTVVLDARGSQSSPRRVVAIQAAGGASVELLGLKLTGGHLVSGSGAGVFISEGSSSVTISDSEIYECSALGAEAKGAEGNQTRDGHRPCPRGGPARTYTGAPCFHRRGGGVS